MNTYKQLKKKQEQLNRELLKCPKCEVICQWEEMIEGAECGACFKGDMDNANELKVNDYLSQKHK